MNNEITPYFTVKDADALQPGDKLSLRLARGTRQVVVDDSA